MPELPEVSAIQKKLTDFIVGHTIKKIEVRNPKVVSGDIQSAVGATVQGVRRFAKVLSIDLSNTISLVIHIKLTGQLIYRGPHLKSPPSLSTKVVGGVPGPHTHVIFHLDKDGVLYYNDLRRFGWIKVMKTDEVETSDFIGKLGPEPFGTLTLDIFKKILSSSKRPIKVVLMDQEKMGGVGNIYANDALWKSQIHPSRAANSLSEGEAKKLYDALLDVLKAGIEHGGASELMFVTPDGTEGNYQDHTVAYGRQGQLCQRCKKEKMTKFMLSGRGTYICPHCQPEQ